jgi:hypothetical protein
MASVIAGLAGGVVATIVMTIGMLILGDGEPPPTASLVATFAGGTPEAHAIFGIVLHLFYRSVAGTVFAVGVSLVGLSLGSLTVTVGLGLVYGIFLMIGGILFCMCLVLGIEPHRDMLIVFGTVHVVYGVVLGAFLGTGVLA